MNVRRATAAVLATVAVTLGVTTAGAQTPPADTFTDSTLRITTIQRIDLPDAEATECEAPAVEPVLVSETATALEPTYKTIITLGPATIYIGENEQTPYQVGDDETNFNTRTTYETVITQTFQATAAGPPCAVVAAARFTG